MPTIRKPSPQLKNGPAPGEGGAPVKQLDPKMAERLAAIQCTDKEIAHCLGVHETTLVRRKQDDPEFAEILERARSTGRMSLRRKQWEAAQAGNPTMLIWMGKQILGQRDRHEVSGEDGASPIMLHLVAVREVGRELIAEREAAGPPTIQHETLTNSTATDLDAPALE